MASSSCSISRNIGLTARDAVAVFTGGVVTTGAAGAALVVFVGIDGVGIDGVGSGSTLLLAPGSVVGVTAGAFSAGTLLSDSTAGDAFPIRRSTSSRIFSSLSDSSRRTRSCSLQRVYRSDVIRVAQEALSRPAAITIANREKNLMRRMLANPGLESNRNQ